MDNIIIEKIWEDECMIEIKITAISKYVVAYQTFYITEEKLNSIAGEISNYNGSLYIETGSKTGNNAPSFSMTVASYNSIGKLDIEVDIEIDDTNNRSHRCIYYVKSNIDSLKRLGNNLSTFYYSDIGTIISLHSQEELKEKSDV